MDKQYSQKQLIDIYQKEWKLDIDNILLVYYEGTEKCALYLRNTAGEEKPAPLPYELDPDMRPAEITIVDITDLPRGYHEVQKFSVVNNKKPTELSVSQDGTIVLETGETSTPTQQARVQKYTSQREVDKSRREADKIKKAEEIEADKIREVEVENKRRREKVNGQLTAIEDQMKSFEDIIEAKNTELLEAQKKIEEKINTKNNELQTTQERINDLNEMVKTKETDLKEIENNITTLTTRVATTKRKIQESNYDNLKVEEGIPLENIDDEIHGRIEKLGYTYTSEKISNILALLKSNKICIFTGTCGCGKSALIQALGKVCGFAVSFIPVKANWHSPEDMLGYYDNTQQKFIHATPFVKAIEDAEAQPDRLHIIALDEMNLARIEYYFSDILSLSEMRDSKDREMTLYSHFSSNNDETEKTENDSKNRMFSEKLNIPDNIRFIGTMNIDETTYSLSPKVLDRVHIVRFESNIENFVYSPPSKSDENEFGGKYLLYSKYFKFDTVSQDLDDEVVAILKNINTILEKYKKEFGYRVYTQCMEYLTIYKDMKLKPDVGFDNFICQKILPRISVRDTKDDNIVIKLLGILPEKYKDSRELLGKIKGTLNAVERDSYSYWDI